VKDNKALTTQLAASLTRPAFTGMHGVISNNNVTIKFETINAQEIQGEFIDCF